MRGLGSNGTENRVKPPSGRSGIGACRHTDRDVKERIGKKPLDVGADKLAKTAHYALAMLGQLRKHLDRPLPLAWAPGKALSEHSVIEAYPAATLIACGLLQPKYKGYKRPDATRVRHNLLDDLKTRHGVEIASDEANITGSDDAFDAVVCVLAGVDFLRGNVTPPSKADREVAAREGWIWCRTPA